MSKFTINNMSRLTDQAAVTLLAHAMSTGEPITMVTYMDRISILELQHVDTGETVYHVIDTQDGEGE